MFSVGQRDCTLSALHSTRFEAHWVLRVKDSVDLPARIVQELDASPVFNQWTTPSVSTFNRNYFGPLWWPQDRGQALLNLSTPACQQLSPWWPVRHDGLINEVSLTSSCSCIALQVSIRLESAKASLILKIEPSSWRRAAGLTLGETESSSSCVNEEKDLRKLGW